ncbi:MAG: CRISPR-associated endoribonuclease Cas6 [Bacteroidota bacterium]
MPFHHQYLLSHFIDHLLKKFPSEFQQYKNYNFSGLKGQTKISKSGLHFYSSRVTLVFSSSHEGFIHSFLTSLFEHSEVKIGNLLLEPIVAEKEEPIDLNEAVKYVCLSPLVLTSPEANDFYSKKFVLPDTDVFSDLLYESTMNRMEKTGAYTSEEIASFYKFQLVPDKEYLSKIRDGEKKFARIYPVFENDSSGKSTKQEVRGYTLPFTLYARTEVQQFLFHSGLGAYTQNGFGMLDQTNAESKKKTMPYQLSNPTHLIDANK